MRVLSVQIGRIEEILRGGHRISTGFRKHQVESPVRFRGVNLEGDDQADRSVHGGRRKAIYTYPSEHYPFWRSTLHLPSLAWGAFGENFTTVDWLERDARVGDRVRIGTAEFEVTQPRSPCFKMNAAFGREDMVARFLSAGRSGFYLGPVREGTIAPDDEIEVLSRELGNPTIEELVRRDMVPGDLEP